MKTNFDQYLAEQIKVAGFAERFKKADTALDVAWQIAALRKKGGFSRKDRHRADPHPNDHIVF